MSANHGHHDIDFIEDDVDALPVGTKLYTSPPQRKPLTYELTMWSLSVDELAIYRDGKRFMELDEGNSNDSWREALRAGSEIVRLLNITSLQRKPLTDEQRKEISKALRGHNWRLGDVIDAVEAAHNIGGKE